MSKEISKVEETQVDSTQVHPTQQALSFIQDAMKNGDVGVMKEAYGFYKEMKADYAKEQFDQAMAKFQMACPVISKAKGVPTRNQGIAYSYAPLDDIVSQTKQLIASHGFSYQTKVNVNGSVGVTVIVKHEDGHSEESTMEVPLGNKTQVMSDSQVVAAASTFAKRYAFCNAFGIMTGDGDTDGIEINTAKVEEVDDKKVEKWCAAFNECTDMKQMSEVNNNLNKVVKAKKITADEMKKISVCALEKRNTLTGK